MRPRAARSVRGSPPSTQTVPGGRPGQAAQHPEQRRLAGAVGAEQGGDAGPMVNETSDTATRSPNHFDTWLATTVASAGGQAWPGAAAAARERGRAHGRRRRAGTGGAPAGMAHRRHQQATVAEPDPATAPRSTPPAASTTGSRRGASRPTRRGCGRSGPGAGTAGWPGGTGSTSGPLDQHAGDDGRAEDDGQRWWRWPPTRSVEAAMPIVSAVKRPPEHGRRHQRLGQRADPRRRTRRAPGSAGCRRPASAAAGPRVTSEQHA